MSDLTHFNKTQTRILETAKKGKCILLSSNKLDMRAAAFLEVNGYITISKHGDPYQVQRSRPRRMELWQAYRVHLKVAGHG